MNKKFVEYDFIAEIYKAGDRAIVKSLLDAEGVIYFIQGENVAQFFYNSIPMRLMVVKEQAGRAKELLGNIELSFSYTGVKNLSKNKGP
ncbi:MAG: DUF2007 domain-containing protein [Deltaproteobacteria bacterium]|nr:DUF2007 domain-containing protein [Deltaproteobacteria bacterium]